MHKLLLDCKEWMPVDRMWLSSSDTKFYWDHVYDKKRLDTKNECVTVTGTVSSAIGTGTNTMKMVIFILL